MTGPERPKYRRGGLLKSLMLAGIVAFTTAGTLEAQDQVVGLNLDTSTPTVGFNAKIYENVMPVGKEKGGKRGSVSTALGVSPQIQLEKKDLGVKAQPYLGVTFKNRKGNQFGVILAASRRNGHRVNFTPGLRVKLKGFSDMYRDLFKQKN